MEQKYLNPEKLITLAWATQASWVIEKEALYWLSQIEDLPQPKNQKEDIFSKKVSNMCKIKKCMSNIFLKAFIYKIFINSQKPIHRIQSIIGP